MVLKFHLLPPDISSGNYYYLYTSQLKRCHADVADFEYGRTSKLQFCADREGIFLACRWAGGIAELGYDDFTSSKIPG